MNPLPEISHRAHKDHREGQFKFNEPLSSELFTYLWTSRSLLLATDPHGLTQTKNNGIASR